MHPDITTDAPLGPIPQAAKRRVLRSIAPPPRPGGSVSRERAAPSGRRPVRQVDQ